MRLAEPKASEGQEGPGEPKEPEELESSQCQADTL